MDVFKIILTMTALFGFTLCEDQVLSIELSLPDIMTTFTTIDQALRTLQGSDIDMTGGNTLAKTLLMRVKWKIAAVTSMILQLRRGNEVRPNVEGGPGSIKSEIVTYPKDYFTNRLKTLLKIKAKQEAMNRDLNAPK